jgi:hypothetical protein
MKGKRCVLFGLICSALLLGTVSLSEASCSMWGKVMYTSQSATYFQAVVTPSTSYYPTTYYLFTLTPTTLANVALIDKMNTAQAANQKVFVVGNASACGTAGTPRAGGVITAVQVSSIY